MKNYYIDESIEQNVFEFNTPRGILRVNVSGSGIYHVYIKKGDCFVHDAIVHLYDYKRLKGKRKLEAIYENWLSNSESEQDLPDWVAEE